MVLLVIDTQIGIMKEDLYAFDKVKHNIKYVITKAREFHIEVIFIRHDDGKESTLTKGNLEYEIFDEWKPLTNERVYDKNVNSPFKQSGLLTYLKDKKEDTIIVCGLQTDFCVDATIKCGFEHGFQVLVPAYANTTVDNDCMRGEESYHYYNHFIWNNRYAKCIEIKELIKRMAFE